MSKLLAAEPYVVMVQQNKFQRSLNCVTQSVLRNSLELLFHKKQKPELSSSDLVTMITVMMKKDFHDVTPHHKLISLSLAVLLMLRKPNRKWNNKSAMIHCKCPNKNGTPCANQKQHSEISLHMQCLLKLVLQGHCTYVSAKSFNM